MRFILPILLLRTIRKVNFSSPIMQHVTYSPILKVALWLGGLSNIFVGILTGIWWPFVTAVAISLHVRLPVPLGMVPPIFDATGNAFVTSAATLIGTLTLFSAYIYKNPIWLISSLFYFGKSLRHHSDMASIREKFRILEINSEMSPISSVSYPPMPLLVRAHPYFLRLYHDIDFGGGVRIRHIKPLTPSTRPLTSSIDFWYRDCPMSTSAGIAANVTCKTGRSENLPVAAISKAIFSSSKKPLFFFIHGGGWKGGGSRRHTQPILLHRLVLNGWAVVACNYRKQEWPQHLDDCYNALQYLISDAESLNIDVSKIVISGASAGGQLAALLHARLKADAIVAKNQNSIAAAMVLFYPAIDPADDTNFTTTFPFDLPFLRAKYGQSLMHWFFERAILNDDRSKWLSASPLRQLERDNSLRESWPPTMIIHGMLDGIVPVEHSLYFLSSLVVRSSNLNASKNFKLESSNNAYTDVDAVTDDYTRYKNVAKRDDNGLPSKKKISVSGNNIDTVLPKELRKSVEVRKFQSEGLIQASENRVAALCVDTQWLMREQDAIVTLPGAKHSFEAVGGDVVDIVCEGVINWLSKVK